MNMHEDAVKSLSSKEIKAILKISDCELMHLRTENKLSFFKKGNAFFYSLPAEKSLLDHPLGQQLLHWYKDVHSVNFENLPVEKETKAALVLLLSEVLLPLQRKFGEPSITYGFTSSALKTHISKNSPKGTAPALVLSTCQSLLEL
jgi:hypothetical protein